MLGLVPISLPYSPLHAFFSRSRIPCKGKTYLGCPLGSVQLVPQFLSVCFLLDFLNSAESSPYTLRGGGLDQELQAVSSRQFSLDLRDL